MKRDPDQLVVRRHSRHECSLKGTARVGEAHAAQIVFSRAVVDGDGSIPVEIVDCSEGGIGLTTGVYLPRGADLRLSFRLPGPGAPAEHELHLRVRRSSMISRAPSYYLGTSHIEHPGAIKSINSLLEWAAAAPARGGAA